MAEDLYHLNPRAPPAEEWWMVPVSDVREGSHSVNLGEGLLAPDYHMVSSGATSIGSTVASYPPGASAVGIPVPASPSLPAHLGRAQTAERTDRSVSKLAVELMLGGEVRKTYWHLFHLNFGDAR